MANGLPTPEYASARKWTGILLFVIGGALALLDALFAWYEVSPIVLIVLFTGGLALFGVQPPKWPSGGGQ